MIEVYRHLGKATPRKDAKNIVTGTAQYIDDVKLPQMLCGRVLRSPYPHAIIRDIDTSKAELHSGVKAVVTYKNAPPWKGGFPRHRLILDSKVRYVGDAVALVAADSDSIAEEALDLIDVQYQQLPAVFDVEEAIKPNAPQLYTEFPRNIFPRGYLPFGPKVLQEVVMGDVAKGFKEAHFIIEGTCAYDSIPNPLPPEPPGAIAFWEEPDQLTIWTTSQSVPLARAITQAYLGYKINVRVIGVQCGGSYGTKNATLEPIAYAAALAKVTGRPVKIYYSKEEHFGTYTLRLGSRIHAKIGIRKDGKLTAVSGEWLVNSGAASEATQGMIAVGCGEAQLVLRCQNWNFQTKAVCTNRNPSGCVRGFGGQELKSALLPIVAMALEKADINPVDFFKKNFAKAGDTYYWRDGNLYVDRSVDYANAMERGADIFGWQDKWKGWGKPTFIDGTKRYGVGVGIHGNADVGEDESEAYVKLNPDSTAVIQACVSESGMGQRSNLCKMVAEVLNLPIENVQMAPPDTLVNPFDYGLVGSRGTYTVGSAVIAAAEEAKYKLFELAGPLLEENSEDLETVDGRIFVRHNQEKNMPWFRVMGQQRTVTGQGRFEHDFSLHNFMMLFVEVAVDVETGKTELLNVVAATDCGQIIDPLVLEGQLYGALGSAGIDSAFFEESVLDETTGRILNINMIDYKWRTFVDLPEFNNVILETPMPSHRFKAVGVGEITTAPGPSAVFMAVYNAIGKKIMEYPITPDKILMALGKI